MLSGAIIINSIIIIVGITFVPDSNEVYAIKLFLAGCQCNFTPSMVDYVEA